MDNEKWHPEENKQLVEIIEKFRENSGLFYSSLVPFVDWLEVQKQLNQRMYDLYFEKKDEQLNRTKEKYQEQIQKSGESEFEENGLLKNDTVLYSYNYSNGGKKGEKLSGTPLFKLGSELVEHSLSKRHWGILQYNDPKTLQHWYKDEKKEEIFAKDVIYPVKSWRTQQRVFWHYQRSLSGGTDQRFSLDWTDSELFQLRKIMLCKNRATLDDMKPDMDWE